MSDDTNNNTVDLTGIYNTEGTPSQTKDSPQPASDGTVDLTGSYNLGTSAGTAGKVKEEKQPGVMDYLGKASDSVWSAAASLLPEGTEKYLSAYKKRVLDPQEQAA